MPRHCRLIAYRKKTPVATTAIACELADFLWVICQQVAPQAKGRCGCPIMSTRLSLGGALSQSIPRAKRSDPGGPWGLAAQHGQAQVCCHVMNADAWPHLRHHTAL
jgi:hypothetical protein